MTVNELIKQLQEIAVQGGGNHTVFFYRPSNICRLGADENIITYTAWATLATEGHHDGVQLG